MDNQLKCVLQLSLKEMVLRRVAVLLWSSADILTSYSTYQKDLLSGTERIENWRKNIEVKVKDKIPKLELPELLNKQMIDIVRSIGLEIRNWKVFHYTFLNGAETIFPDSVKLCWTTAGTINYQKTAEALVRCKLFNVWARYRLACYYCLEDYILPLWEELPKETKRGFILASFDGLPEHNLVCCWPDILRGDVSKYDYWLSLEDRNLTSFNQWAFEHSAECGNKTAAEYFFQKLTLEEREISLIRTVEALLSKFKYDFFYLLCLMTPEQQMELVKKDPNYILISFLYWPWQDLFMENARLIWSYMPPINFTNFVNEMAGKFKKAHHYFPHLFREFFVWISSDLKKHFVGDEYQYIDTPACRFLITFILHDDSESIKVIFKNVDAADRVKIIFQHHVLDFFYDHILVDRWHMIEVCLREATLSEENRKRLKKVFTEEHERKVRRECENQNLERFFDFLDRTNASAEVRKQ